MIKLITKNFIKHPFKTLIVILCFPVVLVLDLLDKLGDICYEAESALFWKLDYFVIDKKKEGDSDVTKDT